MNIFRRNQVVITALVIMIAIAGYLSFTQRNTLDANEVLEINNQNGDTSSLINGELSSDIQQILDEMAAVKDTTDVANGEDLIDVEDVMNVGEADDKSEEVVLEEIDSVNPGEAIFTNAGLTEQIVQAKFNREQARAKSNEQLLEIINNMNLADGLKQDAVKQKLVLAQRIEQENDAEALLAAKGFNNVFVMIDNETVDVIIKSDNLTDAQRAQIEDIVKRKANVTSDKIIINPIKTKN